MRATLDSRLARHSAWFLEDECASIERAKEVAAVKVVVFGATGGVGRRLVEFALSRDYWVTAAVRDPTKVANATCFTGKSNQGQPGRKPARDCLRRERGGRARYIRLVVEAGEKGKTNEISLRQSL